MKKQVIIFLLIIIACNPKPKTTIAPWVPYDESEEITANAAHHSKGMRYKLIQSKVLDKNDLWKVIQPQIGIFSEEDYQSLKPLIFEQNIPTIQAHIAAGELTYEKLVQWYLYRIVKYENNRDTYLNAIIAINPNAVKEARLRDKNSSENDHPIYGMPVLLKDNINAEGMTTTAGAYVFKDNKPADAFITARIKEKGGIILGKANLSEWANFLFLRGPNGFSAVGGQTLNPYGRKIFDTGGSSSGSAAGTAANYAAAAIGTETSGSILFPSSKNSVIGLKPTTGLLSRNGIVPLSSAFDTPGPITRNVTDNAILLSAMSGKDEADSASEDGPGYQEYWKDLSDAKIEGMRFGVNSRIKDSIYLLTVEKIVSLGGIAVEFEPATVNAEGYGDLLLGADMLVDLPEYINTWLPEDFAYRTVPAILDYNLEDSTLRIPYGQGRIAAILPSQYTEEQFMDARKQLHEEGVNYFEKSFTENQLDAILSVNNYEARNAAMANYPCLTIPMGYTEAGGPMGLTFIVRPFEEGKLLRMAFIFEQGANARVSPKAYE